MGVEIDSLIVKFIWKYEEPRIAKTAWKKNILRLTIATAIKRMCIGIKIDQWNRIESRNELKHM